MEILITIALEQIGLQLETERKHTFTLLPEQEIICQEFFILFNEIKKRLPDFNTNVAHCTKF